MTDDEKQQKEIESTNEALIDYGLDAISKMMAVAEDTEHPRAYEVLSKLIKDVADINNSRIDNKKKLREIKKMDEQKTLPPGSDGSGPTILAITTDELLRSFQESKEKLEKDITPNASE
jgi:homoserine kinase